MMLVPTLLYITRASTRSPRAPESFSDNKIYDRSRNVTPHPQPKTVEDTVGCE